FEGISILINIGMTCLGMWLGSVLPARDLNEQNRIAAFFSALDTPILPSEAHTQKDDSARPALGAATMVVGFLLVLAGLFAPSAQARWIDLSFGLALIAFGRRFLRVRLEKREKESESVTV
ncbi:MAG TPA: hypothetical protein VI479_05250, partial [Blastocatellia bacterium]